MVMILSCVLSHPYLYLIIMQCNQCKAVGSSVAGKVLTLPLFQIPTSAIFRLHHISYVTRPAQVVRQVRHLPDHFSGQTPEKTYNIGFHQL